MTCLKVLRSVLVCCSLFLAISAPAQKYPSLFWEVTGKNLTQPSYLYGTVHSFDSSAFRFVPIIAPKIAASDVFAMEMLLDMESQDFMSMLQFVMMPGDTTLAMLLNEKQLQRVNQYMTDSVGLPMMLLTKVKPFFLMAMMMESGTSMDVSRFLDDSLSQIAENAKRKVIGIETIEEQLGAIDRIPLHEQAYMLSEEIDSVLAGSQPQNMDELLSAYETGTLDTLHHLYNQKEFSNTFELALVTDRNRRMADRIASYLADNVRMFVAVGALHLPGEEGLIDLLRKKGYTVTPIALK